MEILHVTVGFFYPRFHFLILKCINHYCEFLFSERESTCAFDLQVTAAKKDWEVLIGKWPSNLKHFLCNSIQNKDDCWSVQITPSLEVFPNSRDSHSWEKTPEENWLVVTTHALGMCMQRKGGCFYSQSK